MLVIIVGDDQALRLQLARALGPGRFDLLCAVPTADGVQPVEEDERIAALLAHRSATTMRADIERLKARFGERVAVIAIASEDGRELESLVGEVDDFVAWGLGPAFLTARLHVVQKRFLAARTARSPRPMRSAIEDLLRTALGSGRDHLYIWDLASGRLDWPFEGESGDQLPATREAYLETIHPDDLGPLEVALEKHFVAQTPLSVAVRRGTPDHGFRLNIERGELLGSRRDGRVIGLVTDIDAEVAVEVSRKLESRRTGIAEVAGMLADELSQSLIAAFTNLDAALAQSSGELKRTLGDARTGLQGAFEWTRRLMALGRRQPPQPEYISLQDLVADLVDTLARKVGSLISLELVSYDASGVVLADPMHMETVLTILSERSARAMPRGGTLEITLKNVLLRDEVGTLPSKPSDLKWMKLAIRDDGPHLPAAALEHNFDPMSYGLREGVKWSISMATVRSIVQQHEGFVRARNLETDVPGHGVTFEVFLPLVARPPARLRRPETGSHVAPGAGELVLVADDDELIRRMIERLLRGSGYEVISASDGREAVRLFEEHRHRVRLVVLDIVMPEMGGRVASERIRALGEEVPFIFMSGYTMSALDSDFVQDAGRRFLPKPFNGGQLLREVRAAIT
jgi:CheY-like chemotaxis protein